MIETAHAALIRFWCDAYVERVGAKYPFNGGKDGKTIKWLREIYSDEDIKSYMTAFFEIDDDFIQDSGYGLGVFRGCLPKVIQYVQQQGQRRARRGQAPAFPDWTCPHTEPHTSKFGCDQATQLNKPRKVSA